MSREREYETSIEVLRGEGDDAEYVEVEIVLHYSVASAEPDVGIMSDYADDYRFTLPDGSPLPADVAQAIDDDKGFAARQIERAFDEYEPDYPEYEPDYD